MLRRRLHLAGLSALSLASGCCWLHDRANDLLDPLRVDVLVGPGLYIDARVTDFVAVAAGAHGSYNAGVHGRFAGTGKRVGVGWPLFMLGHTEQDMSPLLGDDSSYEEKRDILTTQLLFTPAVSFERCGDPVTAAERGVRVADIGATATVALAGISVGFSPGELLDFVLGFVGIDLAGDDVARASKDEGAATDSPETKPPAAATTPAAGR